MQTQANPLLKVRNLSKVFPIEKGFLRRQVGGVQAVRDVSFDLYPRETLGLVGESGCGKTTLSRCIVRGIDPTGGQVLYDSRQAGEVDMATLGRKQLRPFYREMQMIFQDPYSSLDARMTVFDIISEPLRVQGETDKAKIEALTRTYAQKVGLDVGHLNRYPHAFSGGQRQRVGIARALITQPKFIVADEPVSALDVSIQAQILNLLQDIQEDMELSFLFISHDLRVIHYVCDRVIVMYLGRIVEIGDTDALYDNPLHPYTQALFSAIPVPDPTQQGQRIMLEGEVANPANPPTGCTFHPRCRYAQPLCQAEVPELRETGDGRQCACHFFENLQTKAPGTAPDEKESQA